MTLHSPELAYLGMLCYDCFLRYQLIVKTSSVADSSPVVFIQRARRAQGEMGTEKGSAR